MGNCITYNQGVTWVDDDDDEDSEELQSQSEEFQNQREEKMILRGKGGRPSSEVKITITKKQLDEMLNGLRIQQILRDLISTAGISLTNESRHWKPALQAIPEASE